MRHYLILFFLCLPATLSAQLGGATGAFSRVGFSSRGMAIGNAGSAVTLEGEAHPYYNPAVVGFAEFYTGSASYAYLPLDRRLNFVSFVGNIGPTAGLGLSWINSGVGNIEQRDISGNLRGTFSTSENLFMLSFANRFTPELSLGVTLRGYLASFYEGVRSPLAIGFDVGAVYRQPVDSLSTLGLALVIADISSQYRTDTTPIYDQSGTTTIDKFPLALRLGASYTRESLFGLRLIFIAAELELRTAQLDGKNDVAFIENGIVQTRSETVALTKSETYLKLGVMIQPIREFKVRVGVDRLGVQGRGFAELARPAAGFSLEYPVQSVLGLLDYTFVLEPYAPLGMSVITLGARF